MRGETRRDSCRNTGALSVAGRLRTWRPSRGTRKREMGKSGGERSGTPSPDPFSGNLRMIGIWRDSGKETVPTPFRPRHDQTLVTNFLRYPTVLVSVQTRNLESLKQGLNGKRPAY